MRTKEIYQIMLDKKSVRYLKNGNDSESNSLGFLVKIYNNKEEKLEKTFAFIQPWEARKHRDKLEKDLYILDREKFEEKYQLNRK